MFCNCKIVFKGEKGNCNLTMIIYIQIIVKCFQNKLKGNILTASTMLRNCVGRKNKMKQKHFRMLINNSSSQSMAVLFFMRQQTIFRINISSRWNLFDIQCIWIIIKFHHFHIKKVVFHLHWKCFDKSLSYFIHHAFAHCIITHFIISIK